MNKLATNFVFSLVCAAIVFGALNQISNDRNFAKLGAGVTLAVEFLFCTAIDWRDRRDA